MTKDTVDPGHHIALRPSIESEQYFLQDEDPLSSHSEALLNEQHKDERSPKRVNIYKNISINLFWILTWYTFATILSVYNKWMFSKEHYNFHYPLFVTGFHMITQFLFSGITILLVPRLRPKKRPSLSNYLYKILPCAIATSLDIGLSNLSLKTITLSFYTMCKSSTLAFVLLFAFIFKLEKITWQLILIITIITSGVILMVSDETDFSFVGFVQVMSAAAFGGLRWSLTEILLRKESMGLTNPFASIFFLAPIQAAILLILSATVEGFITIFRSSFFLTFAEGLDTMGVILLGSGVSFFMIVSEFFLIKRTSVVTLSVCGIFKEAATIFISCVTFGDVLTPLNIVGLCVTLFGIGLYNWLKLKKTQEPVESNQKAEPHSMYNNVAESTPMLLVNSGDFFKEDDEDEEDEDISDRQTHPRRDDIELR